MLFVEDVKREVPDLTQNRRTGRWWGRCPFHVEATGSFMFDEKSHKFFCLGCGLGGESAEWFRQLELKGRREAAEERRQARQAARRDANPS